MIMLTKSVVGQPTKSNACTKAPRENLKKTNVCSRENKKIWYETEKTKKTLENIT